MCGLFGVVLPHHYPHTVRTDRCLQQLGLRAEERGCDAAGIAVQTSSGRWAVRKTFGPFRELIHTPPRWRQLMSQSKVALGHTRWATQGGRSLAQASPLAAASLLCTHNGDVDPATIPLWAMQLDVAATDSHHLFRAIADADGWRQGHTDRLVQILAGVHGPAALVWTDTAGSDHRVWLARGGLSPLAVGLDQHGGLWWASNPAWLREMADHAGLQMTVTLLPEGSLWVLVPHQQHVTRTKIAEFTPTVRCGDETIARHTVWRGFTVADRTQDETLLQHHTVA